MKKITLLLAIFFCLVIVDVAIADEVDIPTQTRVDIETDNDVGAEAKAVYAPIDSRRIESKSFSFGGISTGHGTTATVPVDSPDGYGRNRFENTPSAIFADYMGCVTLQDYRFFIKDRRRSGRSSLEKIFEAYPVVHHGYKISKWESLDRIYFLGKFNPRALNGRDAEAIGYLPVIKKEVDHKTTRMEAYMYAAGIAAGFAGGEWADRYKATVLLVLTDTQDLQFKTKGFNLGTGMSGALSVLTGSNPFAGALGGIGGYAQAMNQLEGRPGVIFLMVRCANLSALEWNNPPRKKPSPEPKIAPPEVKRAIKPEPEVPAEILQRQNEANRALNECSGLSPKNLENQLEAARSKLAEVEFWVSKGDWKTERVRELLIAAQKDVRAARESLSSIPAEPRKTTEKSRREYEQEINLLHAQVDYDLSKLAKTEKARNGYIKNAVKWALQAGLKGNDKLPGLLP